MKHKAVTHSQWDHQTRAGAKPENSLERLIIGQCCGAVMSDRFVFSAVGGLSVVALLAVAAIILAGM